MTILKVTQARLTTFRNLSIKRLLTNIVEARIRKMDHFLTLLRIDLIYVAVEPADRGCGRVSRRNVKGKNLK